ncbi:MAG: AmmeMemoRadiSam system protein B [Oleiphilus sp.]|nr:MAG: AmmeMemoRadiSam system protein B [Oleiphilus sp.]
MTTSTRSPAVSGLFYPDDANELTTQIAHYLAQAEAADCRPKALIAPHAGYMYSGLTAAYAYKNLIPIAGDISRVVLLGPSHRVGFSGMAVPSSTAFGTPLGDVPLDLDAIEALSALPQIARRDDAHAAEHSLEVHLPFLQHILSDFKLLPIVVGDCTAEEVSEVIERLWGKEETLIVVSSDLSHFHDYGQAQEIDRRTGQLIENYVPELVGAQACGCKPINGLLLSARRHGLSIQPLDMRNSGDTSGPKDRVVGYASYALH